jgi:hypothetical protein
MPDAGWTPALAHFFGTTKREDELNEREGTTFFDGL